MSINRYAAHPVVLSDRLEENIIDPVSSAPAPGVLGLPVYAVQGAGVQPTEDSADGVPASAPPAVAMQVAGSDGSFLRVLSTDSSGKLNVNATFTGSAGNAAASQTGSAVPAFADFLGADNGSGTLIGLKATTNGLKVDGSAVTQPVSGTVAVSNFPATQPVSGTVAATQSGTWTVQPGNTANTTAWKVDGSAVTQPVSGSVNATLSAETTKVIGTVNVASGQTIGISAGSAVIGHVIVDTAPSTAVTNAGTFAVQATLAAETTKVIGTVNIAASQTIGISAGSAVIGHVIVDTAPSTAVTNAGTFAVQQTPKTSGGMGLPFSASVNATKQQVKATAGNVYGWNIVNNTAAIAYCQVFNLASANVTVGSTAPDYVIAIPGNSTTGAGNTVALDLGISHSTGITIACTTTRTGSTNAACDVLFFFN